jgi:hypothetical protein
MAIQEREADLVIATFGRAIWILDDIRPLRKLAANKGQLNKPVQLFDTPEAIQAQYRNAPGYEWSTWGIWDADNKPRGASVSYFIQPVKKDTSKNAKADSALVKIYNEQGALIRNLKWKADTGFNRSIWRMDERGYRFPGSPKPKPGDPEPGGQLVLPGTYKLVMEFQQAKDSTMITIKDDPRLGNRNAVKLAQNQQRERLRKSSDQLTIRMDKLTEAEDVCKKVEAHYKDVTGASADSIRKQTKVMQDSIKAIREFISGKTQTRQGYGQVPQVTVMNQLQQANQSIGSKPIVPGPQEEMLVVRAEQLIAEAVGRVDRFMAGPWASYRTKVEGTKQSFFKE